MTSTTASAVSRSTTSIDPNAEERSAANPPGPVTQPSRPADSRPGATASRTSVTTEPTRLSPSGSGSAVRAVSIPSTTMAASPSSDGTTTGGAVRTSSTLRPSLSTAEPASAAISSTAPRSASSIGPPPAGRTTSRTGRLEVSVKSATTSEARTDSAEVGRNIEGSFSCTSLSRPMYWPPSPPIATQTRTSAAMTSARHRPVDERCSLMSGIMPPPAGGPAYPSHAE